jgi:hypothetical protein
MHMPFQAFGASELVEALTYGRPEVQMPAITKRERRNSLLKKLSTEIDPTWQLECRSRQCELRISKILLRCWTHAWQK